MRNNLTPRSVLTGILLLIGIPAICQDQNQVLVEYDKWETEVAAAAKVSGKTKILDVSNISQADFEKLQKASFIQRGTTIDSFNAQIIEEQTNYDPKRKSASFNFSNLITTDGDSVVIHLRKDDKANPVMVTLFYSMATGVEVDPGDQPESEVPALSFLPPPALEQQWQQSFRPYSDPPLLNRHTRWALTYDYTRQDPVAAWKRSNKVAATSCTLPLRGQSSGRLASFSNATDMAMAISTLKKRINSDVAGNKKTSVTDSTLKSLDKLMADLRADHEKAKLKDYYNRLYVIDQEYTLALIAENGTDPAAGFSLPVPQQDRSSVLNGCCNKVYCVSEAARFVPTVGRNLLVSALRYNPYRDSFVLSVEYNDQFTGDAALFASAFGSTTGVAGSTPAAKAAASDDPARGLNAAENEPESYEILEISIIDKYRILYQELSQCYQEKYSLPYIDVRIVANTVAFIQSRMTEELGITDFSTAGITQKALSDTEDSAKVFAEVVQQVCVAFEKVVHYKVFDSKSILVKNQDVININLQRYQDGKLMSSSNESQRPYYTGGGIKADFSVGLFGNFLVDDAYTSLKVGREVTTYYRDAIGVIHQDSIVKVDQVTRDSIIKDDKGNFNIGPAVFAHFYCRTGMDLNLSATIGFAINQQGAQRYLLGGSLLFGRNSRWAFTAGLL